MKTAISLTIWALILVGLVASGVRAEEIKMIPLKISCVPPHYWVPVGPIDMIIEEEPTGPTSEEEPETDCWEDYTFDGKLNLFCFLACVRAKLQREIMELEIEMERVESLGALTSITLVRDLAPESGTTIERLHKAITDAIKDGISGVSQASGSGKPGHPEPTIEWLGYYIIKYRTKLPGHSSVITSGVKPHSWATIIWCHEIGLRSDGTVVWRKTE
jgi:hypothetical protein